MESVKNSKSSAFQLLSQRQRQIFIILLVLLFSGVPSLRWLMSLITPEQVPGIYGFVFQALCLLGVLLLLHKTGAVGAKYIALFALILSACLILAYRG
jgi:hypothetical protein